MDKYIKWFTDQVGYIKKVGGFGSVQLRINIRNGQEDVVEKISIITDKVKGSTICASL